VGDPSNPLAGQGVFLFNTSYDIWGGTGYLVIVNASSDPSTAAIPAEIPLPVESPLAETARAARKPLPPDERVGALHDTVHREVGQSRLARTIKVDRTP
jgi:hypothetical protein